LLIGGQACIIYGAAEFSRDSDFVIMSDPENIARLKGALKTLKAELVYVPPLEAEYLERGHACHFRCNAKDVKGLRIDIMSTLRGCDGFDMLWNRRKRIAIKGAKIDIIGLRDLVQSKKTQRDKDWLMLKRLVDNDISLTKEKASGERIKWWLMECRDPGLLSELAARYPEMAKACVALRPPVSAAIKGDVNNLASELRQEELEERKKDVEYWAPLRKELELLRRRISGRDSS
jgi:hypothetical protein